MRSTKLITAAVLAMLICSVCGCSKSTGTSLGGAVEGYTDRVEEDIKNGAERVKDNITNNVDNMGTTMNGYGYDSRTDGYNTYVSDGIGGNIYWDGYGVNGGTIDDGTSRDSLMEGINTSTMAN